jgi:hypothetical protein
MQGLIIITNTSGCDLKLLLFMNSQKERGPGNRKFSHLHLLNVFLILLFLQIVQGVGIFSVGLNRVKGLLKILLELTVLTITKFF